MMILSQYHIFELDTINIYSAWPMVMDVKSGIMPPNCTKKKLFAKNFCKFVVIEEDKLHLCTFFPITFLLANFTHFF